MTKALRALEVLEFFETLAEKEILTRIRREVKERSEEVEVKRKGILVEEIRRGKSLYVLEEVHKFVDAEHGCRNSEVSCLLALATLYFPVVSRASQIIDSLSKVILIPKRCSLPSKEN